MASLNTSINGPSIKSSYQGVINGPAPPSGSSSTFGQWALFSVQAPLANAFQDSGSKESVLKVQTTGEGELDELLEDFNEGRIQFAFVKVKDPNTGLPKYVLIAWCGGGVPERTKGYFTSHAAAVSKILHGYHVQITARSEADLAPETIIQKVADASGAKYTAGGSAPVTSSSAPPPVKTKPVFPTSSSSFNPIVAARNRSLQSKNDDGWGDDAPQVSRTELQKVESAYKPTKVDIAALRSQQQEPSRFNGSARQEEDRGDVVRGAYQPIGKVDIAAIRAAAKEKEDYRPTPVKGSYEPVGKVDIAAIRAKAQKPSESAPPTRPAEDENEQPKPVAERSAAFSQPERLTELPKPKVAKKFGGASAFTGTKAPTPGGLGFGSPAAAGAPPVGTASRTFADEGGKTPAQIWAEKKAKQGGGAPAANQPATSPVSAQRSGGGWQSGYAGKSWAPVQTGGYARGVTGQKTGESATSHASQDQPASPSGGISALRDKFKDSPAIGQAPPSAPRVPFPQQEIDEPAPPPPPMATRPSGGAPSGGFALPGLPARPPPPTGEEEEEAAPEIPSREESPARVAVPVPRSAVPEFERADPPTPIPAHEIEQELPKGHGLPEEEDDHDPRAAATHVAEEQFGEAPVAAAPAAGGGNKRALIQYDYEKAEDNEIELREGEYVTNIEMVDDDWWMGTNSQGESGLFPSNYVELVEEDEAAAAPAHPTQSAVPPPPAPAAAPKAEHQDETGGATATALFDYEAAEDNELSFPEGATITNLEFPDEDWWFGHLNGASGLFPANYVQLDQ